MAKVFVSYIIDGALELDIPDETLQDPDALQEYLDTHFENVDNQTLFDGLNINDADSIVVKSVFDENETYLDLFGNDTLQALTQ